MTVIISPENIFIGWEKKAGKQTASRLSPSGDSGCGFLHARVSASCLQPQEFREV